MAGAVSAGAGGISALGSLFGGQSTANSLNAQADLQMQNAQEAESQGKYDAMKSSLVAGQKIGAITAGYGASGVSSNSGSALEVLRASASNAELDRLNILHGADVKAVNYENQASLDRLSASSALNGSIFSAIGNLGLGIANGVSKGLGSAGDELSLGADELGAGASEGATEFAGAAESSGLADAAEVAVV